MRFNWNMYVGNLCTKNAQCACECVCRGYRKLLLQFGPNAIATLQSQRNHKTQFSELLSKSISSGEVIWQRLAKSLITEHHRWPFTTELLIDKCSRRRNAASVTLRLKLRRGSCNRHSGSYKAVCLLFLPLGGELLQWITNKSPF